MTSPNGTQAWLRPQDAGSEALPHPSTERWQPLRIGLVDLFYYDDEQFWFHDGRLLLRGNNGTGKGHFPRSKKASRALTCSASSLSKPLTIP